MQANQAGITLGRRGFRFGKPFFQTQANVISRLRTGFYKTLAFQKGICLQDRADAYSILTACLTHRGEPLTRRVGSMPNQIGNPFGKFLIKKGLLR